MALTASVLTVAGGMVHPTRMTPAARSPVDPEPHWVCPMPGSDCVRLAAVEDRVADPPRRRRDHHPAAQSATLTRAGGRDGSGSVVRLRRARRGTGAGGLRWGYRP